MARVHLHFGNSLSSGHAARQWNAVEDLIWREGKGARFLALRQLAHSTWSSHPLPLSSPHQHAPHHLENILVTLARSGIWILFILWNIVVKGPLKKI